MAESLSVIRIRGRGGSNSDRRIGAGGLYKYVRGSDKSLFGWSPDSDNARGCG